MEKIPDDLGTAVNVQTMVFGNKGEDSGTGVAFTRNPSTGESAPYGDFLTNAQGEDVVAGIRITEPLDAMAQPLPRMPPAAARDDVGRSRTTTATCATSSSRSSRAACTSCRPASASAPRPAALRMAVEMRGRRPHRQERGGPPGPARAARPAAAPAVRPGREVRRARQRASTPRRAPRRRGVLHRRRRRGVAAAGETVILVRPETSPDDLHGMIAAEGILTSRGGSSATRRSSRGAWASRRSAAPTAPDRPARLTARFDAPATARPCTRATRSRSTAAPARSSSATCRS